MCVLALIKQQSVESSELQAVPQFDFNQKSKILKGFQVPLCLIKYFGWISFLAKKS